VDRNRIWENRKKLGKSGIILKEDLPVEVENNASQLLPILTGARKKGLKCSLFRDTLYINNDKYRVDSLHKMTGALAPAKLTTYETEDTIFFWSKFAPLSNFNQDYPIKIGHYVYTSVEQAYCASKAAFFKDPMAANKIRSLSNPVEIKRTRIEGYEATKWESIAEGEMRNILQTKMEQNPKFKELLKETSPKTLCEAVPYESVWGIGMNVLHKDLENKGKWGKNKLGRILQSLRETL
jgi:hypothetical protein